MDIQKETYKTKNPNKNDDLVNVIKSGLIDLKNEIKDMSEDEKEMERPNEIVDIVKKILDFDQRYKEGLKILTPDQMLSRLPISLAQLKTGNNSGKLKIKLGKYYILCIAQKN